MALRSNMSEHTTKSITKKNIFIQTGFMFVGIFTAMYLEKYHNQPVVGGFIFGLCYSIGFTFSELKKGERYTSVNIGLTLIISCIMAGMYYIFSV